MDPLETAATTEVPPAPRQPRGELLRLVGSQICLHGAMTGLRMAAPLMALRDGHSPIAVGFLLALFAVSQAFMSLSLGRYVDRHDLKSCARKAVLISSSGCALAAVFPVFGVLCFAASLTGYSAGLLVLALQRHVGRAASDTTELKRVFSWLSSGPAISNVLGPVSAGLLIDHAGVWFGGRAADDTGFRAAYLLMALLPWGSWLCVRGVRDMPPLPLGADAGQRRAWELLEMPLMRRLMIINLLMAACWDVHTFMVPVLGHELGFSASEIGGILGGFALSAAFVRLAVLPILAAHLKEWQVLAGSMAASAALLALYPFLKSPLAFGAVSMMLGVFLGAVQPMVMSTLHQIAPPHRTGEALGLRLMAINAASVVMPLLFGSVGAAVGATAVFWSTALVVGVGAHPAWHLRVP